METLVMVTESATSPLDIKVITLEEAGAYQYNAGSQCRVQIKGNGQQVCQEGHYEILSAAADENIKRAFQNQRKILQVQRGAHAEHYDTEHAAQNADAVHLA